MSDDGQHALMDMVELQMYLVLQPQKKPWPMFPRRTKTPGLAKKAHSNPIEPGAAAELMDGGFIEHSSSVTFVVSKSGYAFYQRELKADSPTH